MNDKLYETWYANEYETLRKKWLESMSKEELIKNILALEMDGIQENIFDKLEKEFQQFVEKQFNQEMGETNGHR